MLENFWIDNESAVDNGIICQDTITFEAVEPNVENIKVAGRNGDVLYWDGSYKNVRGRAKCYCLRKDVALVMETVNAWLLKRTDYRRLEVLHDPDFFRMARLVRGAAWEARLGVLNPFDLEFDCRPGKWYKNGELPIPVSTSGTMLFSPSTFESLPVITVHGSGSGTLTIDDITLTLTNCDELVLDCEEQEAIRNGSSANSTVSGVYPALHTESVVTWTGGITGVTIVPRWWTL